MTANGTKKTGYLPEFKSVDTMLGSFLLKIRFKTIICCGQLLLFLTKTTIRHQNYHFHMLRIR